MQLHCSRDINEKCNRFYWFPNHLLYIDHGNTKFSYIYTIKMRKSPLWKTWRWNPRLIYTINKNNKNNNNNNQDRQDNQSFWKISSKRKNFIYYITKNFFCAHLTKLLPLTFSIFFYSKNPSILWSLSILLPKASTSALYLNLHYNKCFLLLNWTKLEILKIYNKNSLWRKSIWPSSSALSILYFSSGNFTN